MHALVPLLWQACCANDLTMNTLLYDLTNHVIIDKSGHGVGDIRSHTLRIPLGPTETYKMWSATGITAGGEEVRDFAAPVGSPYCCRSQGAPSSACLQSHPLTRLLCPVTQLRYLKFWLRAEASGRSHKYDQADLAFVISSLQAALLTNASSLGGFWIGYTLKAQLKDVSGLRRLREWVEVHGPPSWWEEQWLPLLAECAAPDALAALGGTGGKGRSKDGGKGKVPNRRSPKHGASMAAGGALTALDKQPAVDSRRGGWVARFLPKWAASAKVGPTPAAAEEELISVEPTSSTATAVPLFA